MARAECARTSSARSVATWSLRERAVWSFPPSGPISSVRRRSIAMWMSSSSSRNSKSLPSSSAATLSRPFEIRWSSSSSSTPSLARARACAFDCSMSNDARRQSNETEELIRRKSGSWSSAKRPISGLSLGLPTESLDERRADSIDLALGHRGEEGERERALGDSLRDRKLPADEAEALPIGRQQVDAGQVGLRLDPLRVEGRDHLVTVGVIRQLHHEDEPAPALVSVVLARQDDVVAVLPARRSCAELGESLAVKRRDVLARVQQLVETLNLRDPDRGLQIGEAIVESETVVLDLAVVLHRSSVVPLAHHALGDVLVRSDQDAALPRGHLLVRIEREDRGV